VILNRFAHSCHREGVARGDPLWSSKRRDKSYGLCEARWIAASSAPALSSQWQIMCCHREGWKPVAIHWESVSEPHCLKMSIACSGLPRLSHAFLPRNDKCVLLSNRSVLTHSYDCEGW